MIRSESGKPFSAFLGVPYGEAERFKRPKPPSKWEGVFKADRYIECLQVMNALFYLFSAFSHLYRINLLNSNAVQSLEIFFIMDPDWIFRFSRSFFKPNDFGLFGGTTGQEDCLVLNIYTPLMEDTDKKKSYPVLVWIHGGGFVSGSGSPSMYGPEYFMEQPDLILITLNYRLGPLGFLGMNDDVLPGNLGLWDQLLALKWIKKNISAFGGDPERVGLKYGLKFFFLTNKIYA